MAIASPRGLGVGFVLCAALLAAGYSSGPLSDKTSARSLRDEKNERCEKYKIRDLGVIATSNGAMGYQVLNKRGQVVGWSGVAFSITASHAFRTQPNQPINTAVSPAPNPDDLGTLPGGSNSYAVSINKSGQVVGFSETALDPTGMAQEHAFRYARNSATGGMLMQDLGTLPHSNGRSFGQGINASGQVVGFAYFPDPNDPNNPLAAITRAFRTKATPGDLTSATDLGSLGGQDSDNSYAIGINTSGQVVGYSAIGGLRHAFRTAANAPIAPADDLGLFPGGNESFATAINDSGQVVGYAATTNMGPPATTALTHAFRTTPGGKVSDPNTNLGTLPGDSFSEAFAINTAGQVVGTSGIVDPVSGNLNGQQRAFFVDAAANSPIEDLNNCIPVHSGWVLREAHGINDSGQIAGWGLINGKPHAFCSPRNSRVGSAV